YQSLRVLTVNKSGRGDGTGLYNCASRPGKQYTHAGTPSSLEEMVLSSRMWIGRTQFRVAECSQQCYQPTRTPQTYIDEGTVGLLRHQGRETEDTNAYHHAHQHRHAVAYRQAPV